MKKETVRATSSMTAVARDGNDSSASGLQACEAFHAEHFRAHYLEVSRLTCHSSAFECLDFTVANIALPRGNRLNKDALRTGLEQAQRSRAGLFSFAGSENENVSFCGAVIIPAYRHKG